MSGRRSCTNNPDWFCYICGEFTPKPQRRNITSKVKTAYFYYFKTRVGDQDKTWAPHVCCNACHTGLIKWFQGKRAAMPFATPMMWLEPRDHSEDCYFCATQNLFGQTQKTKSRITYPSVRSAVRPLFHGDDFPVLVPPASVGSDQDDLKHLLLFKGPEVCCAVLLRSKFFFKVPGTYVHV